MLKKKTALLLSFVGALHLLSAQESKIYTHDQKEYQQALTLYNNEQFQAAQAIFEKVKYTTKDPETEANSTYYVANAAVRLNQLGADKLMEDFVKKYPTSTKRNSAYSDVAEYYFETGKYPYALKWYKRVDQNSLSQSEKDKFNFNYGYALFSSKNSKEAETYLNKVSNSPVYGSQAKYYLGYIAYQQDDYAGANQRFDQITDQKVLEEKLSYYQADLNFKLGKFEEAIALAKQQMQRADRQEKSELSKIIGESYFNLNQYENAVPYLLDYQGKSGKFSNTDYYFLGYSYYKQGDYANAIQQFNKIIGGANSVSQNAYYHLAECYLKLDKKSEALNAFRNASQMEFVPEIQKDAFLNYARLSYEIGNAYENVPNVLTNYLEKYPKDEHTVEIQELLVDSYITSRNFAGAMELLEKNKSYASKATYQKVAFYRGVELFTTTDYAGAIVVFKKSLDNAEDPKFKARASYWKAEAEYNSNLFKDALNSFSDFQKNPHAKSTPDYADFNYSLGYTNFKLKEYTNAAANFTSYVGASTEASKKHDAYLRLGDSYFASSKYWPAIEAYNQALEGEGSEKDYAAFQKALSYGFIDRVPTKMEELNAFMGRYPKSTLKDDVLFELGNSYVRANKEEEGLKVYDKLVSEYKGSSLVPQAIVRQGLVYYNSNRSEQALTKFKTVVRDYPNTQEAVQAVTTAKLIYVDLGRVSEYAEWVRGLDFVDVTDAELDNATFQSADQKYVEGNTDQALKGYQAYLKEFPKGLHALKASFNLAQLYFGQGDKDKALGHYKNVVDRGATEFGEQSLTRVCEIYIGKGNYTAALPYLEKLEATANIQQNITFAQSNLMKGYFAQKEYAKTISYAEKVLASAKIDDRIKSDAHTMIARSAIRTNNEERAKQAYAQVLTIATGELAAEALFYDAYFKNKANDFEASNVSVQKLAKDYSAYKEWGGKGLIIMAKNFDALGDAYQATYILDSVVVNFAQYPEVVAEAKSEAFRIKSKEAKSNSSVNPEN
ncbi:tetratricopeptide repeat protein [Cellulophaga sp. HaHa_2_95]|uniref:tetratricopeptide repeat protein n=1 Tax=Cellulophaga sp. HaHa_2_95 TaxID=2745558 RepID=UPI001C4EF8FB|nr:tetratricopeptide repeat protein [Cellulophaga sp. HaHa_2_95]QXP57450.1 tetratricopeptide repeat protein [Cellulophaga sp. HaHa_2_95]